MADISLLLLHQGDRIIKKHEDSPQRAVGDKPATVITPVRAADLKSTYIKHSLFEIGAITETDFKKQKGVILEQMNQL